MQQRVPAKSSEHEKLASSPLKPQSGEHNIPSPDFLVWQLIDSAFPTGGFAHSAGLEAAWQHGEVRGRADLVSFLEASLHQMGQAGLPFVTAAFEAPETLVKIDSLCDAFTTNQVANRASRAQGRAFASAVTRIFKPASVSHGDMKFAHFAPIFGACSRELGITKQTTMRIFAFNHLRTMLAAAVRLNIIGPMEAQIIQHQLSATAGETLKRCESLSLDDIAQTAPLQEIWQGAQDRLYSRLFQS